MSIDQSLKTKGATSRHRNVLSRAERIAKLQEEGHWKDETSPFGLIKVAHRKVKVGGKTKKKGEAEATEGEGDKTAEGAS